MAWKFKTFVSQTGRSDVQNTIDKLPPSIREPFATRLRYLANTPRIDWHEPHAKKLVGVEEVYEIRFKAQNKQFRPLGFFGPGAEDFTLTVWAAKKDNIYKPPSAIDTAETRRKEVVRGVASVASLTIDGENFPPP